MASVEPFVHFAPTRVVAGQGSLKRLAEEVGSFGRKCLIVSGRRSARLSGLLGRVTDLLTSKKIECSLFDQVEPNPTTETIKDGADLARSKKVRWVLGVGGGSALDAAKAIALMAVNQGDVRSYCSGMRPENTPFPVVAVPTTSGTGSEVTAASLITDVKAGDKLGLVLPELFPRVAILDPALAMTMPENVTVDTGLDALCHAIEAYFSRRRSPCTDILAQEAIRRIVRSLPIARKDPENLGVRSDMHLAATLSGLCIANTGTLVPHALGYPVTVRYGLSHGRATAVMIPAFLEKLKQAEPERVEKTGELLGERENPPAAMRAFIESLGVAPRLGAYGIREKDAEPFSRLAKSKPHVKNSMGEWPEGALRDVFLGSI
jgi:alcohol dehydrogenase class IV